MFGEQLSPRILQQLRQTVHVHALYLQAARIWQMITDNFSVLFVRLFIRLLVSLLVAWLLGCLVARLLG